MKSLLVEYLYVVAVVLFVLSLRWMSDVKTSRRGNWAGAAGMITAIAATLVAFQAWRTDSSIRAIVLWRHRRDAHSAQVFPWRRSLSGQPCPMPSARWRWLW